MKFSIKDLVTFTEEILNGKLPFLCSEGLLQHGYPNILSCRLINFRMKIETYENMTAFLHRKRLHISDLIAKVYLNPCQVSMIELFYELLHLGCLAGF